MVVELNMPEWRGQFPQYGQTPDEALAVLWEAACVLIGNTASSGIPYSPPRRVRRKLILYAALCHLAFLQARGDLVGNVTSAAEGSVNVSLAWAQKNNSRWWEQSPCGALAWQLLGPFRSGGLYVPG